MKNKYLVIGGVAGGMSAAARLRRLDPYADIQVFEKGPHVSFSNCCLPFHLSDIVKEADDLILMTPELLKSQYNLNVKTLHEVLSIDNKKQTIKIKKLTTGEIYEESYTKLILSPGAKPIMPKNIQGIDSEHVFSVRNVVDIDKIKKYIFDNNLENITVIGGGFIGLEVMESLTEAGKKVTLVEGNNQILQSIDYELVQVLHKEIHDNGVNLILNDTLIKINNDNIILSSGKSIKTDVVIMAIGVLPETELAKTANLKIGETGGIWVNHHYQTSNPNIYAIGDAIEVTHFITNQKTRLTMAGPAQRQARAVADHIMNRTYKNTGVIGSSVVKIFGLNAASTGLNEKDLKKLNIDYNIAYIIPKDKVGLMPGANPIRFKLIFQVPTGKILGAQAIGKCGVDKYINVIATMIMNNGYIQDLAELELCYSPWFSTAKDPVNMAALVACNLLNGEYKQIHITKVRSLVENGAFIIDAREKEEYEESHIKNSVNIPLSEFRDRLDEIPKDIPVYVHCLSSHRSYYMVRELNQRGFNNVVNITGSFLGICEYEYFNDITQNRIPIVTDYKFNLLG